MEWKALYIRKERVMKKPSKPERFDKFSYCKNADKCLRIHPKEVCLIRECDYRRCDKRHPRPCKIFRIRGFCRFGTNCRYSHRLPKEVEDQNKKIDSLSKQVEDQNNEVKDLKIKLVGSEIGL